MSWNKSEDNYITKKSENTYLTALEFKTPFDQVTSSAMT